MNKNDIDTISFLLLLILMCSAITTGAILAIAQAMNRLYQIVKQYDKRNTGKDKQDN